MPVSDTRPWGKWTIIDEGPNYKVKRIEVKAGGRLSLQKHRHRSEHWTIVRGRAQVICGKKTLTLSENQSIYIPKGSEHRLANTGKKILALIEVQCGGYLGEDDIIRLADDYGRK